jgi:hypothetical protein
MASTRNNNTPGDYCQQQLSYRQTLDYDLYKNGYQGQAYTNAIPCLGITPSHMPNTAFSKNAVEIESALFGINSTNLVNPQTPVNPELKKHKSLSIVDRKVPLIMPKDLIIEADQRPFPVPK